MRRSLLLSVLAGSLITSLAAGAGGPLTGTLEARKVVAGDRGEEVYVPADEARPQDVIEYRLTYANDGAAAVHNLSIVDPVPAGVRYLEKTAKAPASGSVHFSIDGGKTFHAWPVRYKKTTPDHREVWADATPEMVTHIRWTMSGDLRPEDEISLSYRVAVK